MVQTGDQQETLRSCRRIIHRPHFVRRRGAVPRSSHDEHRPIIAGKRAHGREPRRPRAETRARLEAQQRLESQSGQIAKATFDPVVDRAPEIGVNRLQHQCVSGEGAGSAEQARSAAERSADNGDASIPLASLQPVECGRGVHCLVEPKAARGQCRGAMAAKVDRQRGVALVVQPDDVCGGLVPRAIHAMEQQDSRPGGRTAGTVGRGDTRAVLAGQEEIDRR